MFTSSEHQISPPLKIIPTNISSGLFHINDSEQLFEKIVEPFNIYDVFKDLSLPGFDLFVFLTLRKS